MTVHPDPNHHRVSLDDVEDEEFRPAAAAKPKRRTTVPEASPQEAVLDLFKLTRGAHAVKRHGSAVGGAGQPDIDGCYLGRAFKLEMKRSGRVPTTLQMQRLRAWRDAGAVVGWCTSVEHARQLLARARDLDWTNPLTGPGDPTLEE